MQADSQVVNTVLPHPHLPTIVCCGIDNHVRVFEAGDGGVHLGTPPMRDEHDAWGFDEEDDEEEEDTDEDDEDEASTDSDDDHRGENLARWSRALVDAANTPEEDDDDDADFEPDSMREN